MIIRQYKPADCTQMAKLFYDTVHTVNAQDYTQEQLDAWATGEVDLQAWNTSFLEHYTVVAEQDGIIVGFGDMDDTGYLDRLYVHKDYQHQGIATAICDTLEQAIKAESYSTHASITAKSFFLRRGYQLQKEQQMERHHVKLTNYIMVKKQSDYLIRPESPADYGIVENLTREAFWNVYQPGCTEHYILHIYRNLPDFVPELSLVTEVSGKIIAHIMYSHAKITCDDGRILPILIFGPLSVDPEHQKLGYGSTLVQYSLEKAKMLGYGAVAVTGSPEYYNRFGFVPAYSKNVYYQGMSRDQEFPYFMIQELKHGYLDGAVGTYTDPEGYLVSQEDVDAFDTHFPPKLKLKLPGQLEQ